MKHSEQQFSVIAALAFFIIVRIMVENGHVLQAIARDSMSQTTALLNWKRTLKKRRTSISLNDFKRSRDLISPVWRDKFWYSAHIDVGNHAIDPRHDE